MKHILGRPWKMTSCGCRCSRGNWTESHHIHQSSDEQMYRRHEKKRKKKKKRKEEHISSVLSLTVTVIFVVGFSLRSDQGFQRLDLLWYNKIGFCSARRYSVNIDNFILFLVHPMGVGASVSRVPTVFEKGRGKWSAIFRIWKVRGRGGGGGIKKF